MLTRLSLIITMVICILADVAFAAEPNNIVGCNWSSDLQAKEPKQKPYAHVFEKDSQRLILAAARHEDSPLSTTFSLIRKIFSLNKIDFSVVEAGVLPFEAGVDNAEFIRASQPEDDYYPTGEAGYTALMTIAGGGHFQGGEPTNMLIKNGLSQLGFNQFDVLGFYLVRNLVNKNICDLVDIDRTLSYFKRQLEIGSDWRFSQFSDWYAQTNNKNFACPLQKDEVTPFLDQFVTQKIATTLTNFRDSYISDHIQEVLVKNSTSLVVYGAGHAAPQRCFLEKNGWEHKETIFP